MSPRSQALFSAASIVLITPLVMNRFATGSYGWAAMWFAVVVPHVCLLIGSLRKLRARSRS